MELTQERLDEIGCKGAEAFGLDPTQFTAMHCWDKIAKAIIEEATGEKVTIVEPEPEIPDEAIEVAAQMLWRLVHPEMPWNHTASADRVEYLERAECMLRAAYKAGWGGLRK